MTYDVPETMLEVERPHGHESDVRKNDPEVGVRGQDLQVKQ